MIIKKTIITYVCSAFYREMSSGLDTTVFISRFQSLGHSSQLLLEVQLTKDLNKDGRKNN